MRDPKTKKGAWSSAERAYIKANAATKSVEEIAAHMNRDVETTRRFIATKFAAEQEAAKKKLAKQAREESKKLEKAEEVGEIRSELRNRIAWKKLKDEFDEGELAYFEEEYVLMFGQFREGVLATEEQQIRKAITLDIFMRRNAASRKKLLADIERVDKWLEKASREYKADKDGLDQQQRQSREEFLLNLETQLSSLRAAEQSKTKEYSDLDNRHQKLMEALKATREQRIAKVETSGKTFLSIIRELQDQARLEIEGRQIALMRRATGQEYERLARPHVYDDGNEDQPILSAETVEMLDAAEKAAGEADEDE